jgi:hypothetical protein
MRQRKITAVVDILGSWIMRRRGGVISSLVRNDLVIVCGSEIVISMIKLGCV